MTIKIAPAISRREMKEFIRLPRLIYSRDEPLVPHLLYERKRFFSPKNPIFKFTDVVYLLARDNGRPVGRVTAHINRRHNEYTGERCGFFGFFECEESPEIARALMDEAGSILREKGMSLIRGPLNFSTNEECAFLADGFDKPPTFMMPWNRPCYIKYFDNIGFRTAKNLLAFEYHWQGAIPEHLVRFGEKARVKLGVNIRPINMRDFEKDLERVFEVYNAAWADNWGFVPMTREQFHYAAEGLKSIVDPDLVLIAEKDGKPIAFSLSLPDYNPILKKINGRLFPFGIFHMIFGRKKLNNVRVILMGVLPEFRNRGIDTLLYLDTFRNGLPHGYRSCEMSWILEDNRPMIRALERMGAEATKTYRIFEKDL